MWKHLGPVPGFDCSGSHDLGLDSCIWDVFPLNKMLSNLPAYPGSRTALPTPEVLWKCGHSIALQFPLKKKKTLPFTQHLAWLHWSHSLRRLGGHSSVQKQKNVQVFGDRFWWHFGLDQKVGHSSSFWHKRHARVCGDITIVSPNTHMVDVRQCPHVTHWEEGYYVSCQFQYLFWNPRLLQAVWIFFLNHVWFFLNVREISETS